MKLTNDSMDSSKAQYVGNQKTGLKPDVQIEKVQSKDKTDSVSVGQSSVLQSLQAGDAPFDSDKVESIKQQIKDGTFVVNSSFVADALIGDGKNFASR